jgi:phage baseplate assembly protein gpV
MSRLSGVVPALVTGLDDPKKLGRVKVRFDWQDDGPETYWARVAAPMAGKDRGAFFMPEENDEVLVAFEFGSTAHAYIVGYLWSSPDNPPFGAKQAERGIKTVLGHKLQFDDDSSNASVTLVTQNGYQLKLDDANNKITLSTPDSVTLELDAASGGGPSASLTLPTGNSLTIDSSGVTVNAPVGELNVNALEVNVTATAVNIDAPVTQINGLVQINGALIATAVSAQVYTPSIGDLFGL